MALDTALSEPTLHDEIRALGDDRTAEMVNLQEQDTGIAGVVFVSTAMGSHGPRVKDFLKAGRNQPSFSVSIEEERRVLASSLPGRELGRASPRVIAWVKLNREALMRFWEEGDTWSVREMAAFVAGLRAI